MTKETCCTHWSHIEYPLELVVQKKVEEARTSHQLDPKVSQQTRMDEAKFEKDHPDYLTGNE